MLTVLVPKERRAGETRVAATPETVGRMIKAGLAVTIEAGAGLAAAFADDQYLQAGASLASADAWSTADLILLVGAPSLADGKALPELEKVKQESLLIGFLTPHRNLDMVKRLRDRKLSALAMELLPRITRAQKMDALSSQANLAGYKAVIVAAGRFGRFFPLLMTAAGTVPPAKVLVLGAGVAGLQALATARRLGAVTKGCDVRPEVGDQVKSVGAEFFALPMPVAGTGGYAAEAAADVLRQQQEILKPHVATADVIITTAQVPGKAAPRLITAEMVGMMKHGSLILDMAAEDGGNCEVSRPGEEVVHQGVVVLGPLNLPSTVPGDASVLYARNVLEVVRHVAKDGKLHLDLDDEITRASLLTHDGRILHGPTSQRLEGGST